MKILYVVNNCFTKGNGLSGSARRTVAGLIRAGLDVRILSAANPDPSGPQPDYILPDDKIPVFNKLIRKQGYSFAAIDDRIITEAVRWADIVHLEEPFDLQIRTVRIAEREGVPCTSTYHLHPENFYSSVHLQKSLWFNRMTLRVWRDTVFNHCEIIQCPTESVRRRLEKWHFKPELRVISNGMLPFDASNDDDLNRASGKGSAPAKVYTVISTGRYSVEKDQTTLLRAMRSSRYADRIQLIFAGQGPTEKKLKRMAEKLVSAGILKYPPIFGFYSLSELRALYKQADLYIHCAFVEVEGLSCMEAIETGLVPIIAEGDLTATSQYALSERSVFPARDDRALAQRIDWWLSHDAERTSEAIKYIGLGSEYDIGKSIAQLSQMYEDVLLRARGNITAR